jgi:hypothetical protein
MKKILILLTLLFISGIIFAETMDSNYSASVSQDGKSFIVTASGFRYFGEKVLFQVDAEHPNQVDFITIESKSGIISHIMIHYKIATSVKYALGWLDLNGLFIIVNDSHGLHKIPVTK